MKENVVGVYYEKSQEQTFFYCIKSLKVCYKHFKFCDNSGLLSHPINYNNIINQIPKTYF